MTFVNFITIQYALLIEKIPSLNFIFGSWSIFAAIFVGAYVPLAIGIGYWHRKSQLKIEQEMIFNESAMNAHMWLFIMELIEGKVTEEEKTEMRKMLKRIARKMPINKKSDADKLVDAESKTP
jgi:hypothetical protein